MKIKVTKACHIRNVQHKIGDVVEIDDSTALSLCGGGYAEPLKESKTETATKK